MNKQQAINLLKNLEQSLDDYCELNDEGKTAFRMAIEALNCSEFPNNSDTISRQAAIDALYSVDEYNSRSVKAIKQLPPIQPKRGKWIDLHIKEEVYGEMYKCSVCGDFDFGGCFCPNCGADMRSDDMREVTT